MPFEYLARPSMSQIPIPDHLLPNLGPEMKMDYHWVDVVLRDGQRFRNLVVRGGRYITGRHDDPDGEGDLPFAEFDISDLCRHRVFGAPIDWLKSLFS